MSVQAQYASNVFFSEFRKRARPEACEGIEDLTIQDGHLHLCNTGVNFVPQTAMNVGLAAEDGIARNSVSVKKKSREEAMVSKQQISVAPLNAFEADMRCGFMIPVYGDRNSFAAEMMAEMNASQPSSWPYSSGMPSVLENTRLAPMTASSGANADTAFRPLLDDATLHLHYCQQQAEIDQIIASHGEKLKQTLEEKRQQHTKALLDLVDHSMVFRVRERLVEIEKIRRKNAELEDYVRKLSLESQVWMNIAQSQEALVASLRSNLEQVVAQSNDKTKGRLRESDAEDAESCVYGASFGAAVGDPQVHEIWEVKEQRNCKFCRKKSISVLLLPCRHLCLCTDCDPSLHSCPICGASKDASLQVYMD